MRNLYFRYLFKLYFKNLFSILFGLSFAFASIDYFQHIQDLHGSTNYKIRYIFYTWQVALSLLYPLSIVFALVMTKLSLIKNNTMGAFHSFGYEKKRLVLPMFLVAFFLYLLFVGLNTTQFAYSKDRVLAMAENRFEKHNVNDIFFKYNNTFVYMKNLNPIKKEITEITIFEVKDYQVLFTIHAPKATFNKDRWIAHNAILKTHIYKNKKLLKYTKEYKESIETLQGYKPNIIESLYQGKTLNIIDAYETYKLLKSQNLNSDKIRATLYDMIVTPLFSIALLVLLFFKLPFHGRMVNTGKLIASTLGYTFMVWGVLYWLAQISANGVIIPELTSLLPISLLIFYSLYIYLTDEKNIK